MSDSFYASGFLYNLKTQQILLIQKDLDDNTSPSWSMLGGESSVGEKEAKITFQRIINELLDLDLKPKNIYPIYDYFHQPIAKTNYVFYAEVKNPPSFRSIQDHTLSWVSFNETVKFIFSAHIKQDVIVGERVINLKWRQSQNLQ